MYIHAYMHIYIYICELKYMLTYIHTYIHTNTGPDADTFIKASKAVLKPEKFEAGLAFMFETSFVLKVSMCMRVCVTV
jgi:homogentisate 1,2-dioxygenase